MTCQDDYKFTFHGGKRGAWKLTDYILLNGKNDAAKFSQPPTTLAFRYERQAQTWYVCEHKAVFTAI